MMGQELKGYQFFKNDKVYTITYSEEETETLKYSEMDPSTLEIKEIEYATRTTKTEAKRQFDVTEGKWTYKTSRVVTQETKWLKDRNSHLVGDVLLDETKNYSESSITTKNVKVKALDVSGYKVLH